MKAVIFDLDDTLLHDNLTISEYSVSVFRKLKQQGYTIIAASGRAQLSMKPFVDDLQCVSYYVSCNGAEIWDASDDSLIHSELLKVDQARSIIAFAEEKHCYAQVYEGRNFFYSLSGPFAEKYAFTSKLIGVRVADLRTFVQKPLNKILFISEEDVIGALLPEARARFSHFASVTCSKPIYLEFNPLNATKGNALTFLCSFLNLDPVEVIAIGDSLNDLSMLKIAGCAVTVSNGWDEIRPFCHYIAASNNEDGPAHFLEQHFISEVVS